MTQRIFQNVGALTPTLHNIVSSASEVAINKAFDDPWIVTQMRRAKLHLLIDRLHQYDSQTFDRDSNGIKSTSVQFCRIRTSTKKRYSFQNIVNSSLNETQILRCAHAFENLFEKPVCILSHLFQNCNSQFLFFFF